MYPADSGYLKSVLLRQIFSIIPSIPDAMSPARFSSCHNSSRHYPLDTPPGTVGTPSCSDLATFFSCSQHQKSESEKQNAQFHQLQAASCCTAALPSAFRTFLSTQCLAWGQNLVHSRPGDTSCTIIVSVAINVKTDFLSALFCQLSVKATCEAFNWFKSSLKINTCDVQFSNPEFLLARLICFRSVKITTSHLYLAFKNVYPLIIFHLIA